MKKTQDIKQIDNKQEKERISRFILEDLKDWFGIDSYRETYIENSANMPFFAAYKNDEPIGFIVLKETSIHTAEIYCMGVIKLFHKNGVGKHLFEAFKTYAIKQNYKLLQVKTVKEGVYDVYDQTNRFYQSVGFYKLEVLDQLWDAHNPCQIWVMPIILKPYMDHVIAVINDLDVGYESVPFNPTIIRHASRGIVINDDGCIAVIFKKDKNEFKLPGGGIEGHETPEDAFKREVLEETGATIKKIKKIGLTHENKSLNQFMQISHVFIAYVDKHTGQTHYTKEEAEVNSSIIFKTVDEAYQLISNCYKHIIGSTYESLYSTRFIVLRDRKILEYYMNHLKSARDKASMV